MASQMPDQDPSDALHSPGGQYRLRLLPMEMRMSHWIMRPMLERCADRRRLFGFIDPSWSVDDAHWLNAAQIELKLRRYPGNHQPAQLCVRIDCRHQTARIGTEQVPWSQLEALAERSLHPVEADAAPKRGAWRDWLRRLLGLG